MRAAAAAALAVTEPWVSGAPRADGALVGGREGASREEGQRGQEDLEHGSGQAQESLLCEESRGGRCGGLGRAPAVPLPRAGLSPALLLHPRVLSLEKQRRLSLPSVYWF